MHLFFFAAAVDSVVVGTVIQEVKTSNIAREVLFVMSLLIIIIIIIIIIFSFTSVLHAGMRWTVFRKLTSKLTYL